MLALRSAARSLLALGLLLGASAALAEPAPTDPTVEPPRPRIGLVLSGGGARGIAHVGVLQVLHELRVPVDYVAGTSMGSVVGGLYASGMTPAELEHAVETIDWDAVFDDRTPRKDVSFRRKQDSFDFLTSLRVWIKDFKVALPKGLIFGQKLINLLADLSLPAATVRDFDELPVPFRAVATDATTGTAVALGRGELVKAIFASMAIPGVFSPVEIDGKLFVDGGVANNLPVDVAKAMGADVVIAVDIAGQLLEGEEVTSVFAVSGQSLTALLARNTAEQVALLSDRDLLIKPPLVGLGAGSFGEGKELIAGGYAAADALRPSLVELSLSEEQYAEHLASRRRLPREPPVITSVAYDNRSALSDYVIEERFDVILDRPLDLPELERDIAMLYGEEIFDRVTWALDETQEGAELILRTYGKEQGRNYLRFGLQLESDFQGESNFDISILAARNPVNGLGGEWRSRLQVGNETRFYTEFFQPFTPRSRLFVLPSFSIGLTTRDVFNEGGDRLAKYRISDLDVQLAVGTHISNVAEIKLGGGYRNGKIERTSGDPQLFRDGDFDGPFAFGRITVDTLDSVAFPRSGAYGFVEGDYVPNSVGDDDIQALSTSLTYAWSFGDTTLVPSAFFGTTFGNEDALPTFSLGGFLELSGLPPESRTGSSVLFGRLLAYHRIANPRIISWSMPVYLGASFEAGNTFDDLDEIEGKRIDFAGSVFLGIDTFLGPIYVAYGHAEGGNNAGYIFVGQVF